MAKINMQELLEDRENGTVGPWATDCSEHEQPYQDIVIKARGVRKIVSVALDDAPLPDFNCEQRANTRRIARLPDLEEAYIEAVEALKKIASEAYVSVDENYPGSWRGVAVERIDIARDFLERNG